MNASFVFNFLALCYTAGAVDFPKLGSTLSFRNHRGVLTVAPNAKCGHISSATSKQNTSHPYHKIDYGFKRNGTGFITYYGVSIQECIQYCRDSDSCLAINYQIGPRNCLELTTLGTVSADSVYATCFVKYKTNDDPCNEVYWMKGHGRWYFVYKRFLPENSPTAKDCCMKCREEPESRCKAWTFRESDKVCFLQDDTPTLETDASHIFGFGVNESS